MRRPTFAAACAAVLTFLVATQPTTAQQLVEGQVVKIDDAAGKITLKHGPIKKLEMDEGMTMVFKAQDPAMLKSVKVGDKVKFDADRVNGQITLTRIDKIK
jgi:Cu/Ag efflux protein CusF